MKFVVAATLLVESIIGRYGVPRREDVLGNKTIDYSSLSSVMATKLAPLNNEVNIRN
jgi:hypothetical protein